MKDSLLTSKLHRKKSKAKSRLAFLAIPLLAAGYLLTITQHQVNFETMHIAANPVMKATNLQTLARMVR